MTYLFVIVGALVFFFCYWRWTKRKMEKEERIASFAGKVAICPYRFEPKDIPDQIILKLEPVSPGRIARETIAEPDQKYPCGANLAEAGVWKKQKRKGDIFDCSNCGEISTWDMDRAPPVLIDWDQPREPRKPRRPRRRRGDDKHPAILTEPRSTTIRPGEKPSDAVARLDQGEGL